MFAICITDRAVLRNTRIKFRKEARQKLGPLVYNESIITYIEEITTLISIKDEIKWNYPL